MFSEVKKQFKKVVLLGIPLLDIPFENLNLHRYAGINAQDLEKADIENKYIVEDKVQVLDVIGAFLESVCSYKEIDNNNQNHLNVENSFSNFITRKPY